MSPELMKKILLELYCVLSAAVIIFAGLELIWPGIILAYFNLNYLLLFWLVAGIIILFLKSDPYAD